jgi:hypothetical protein
MKKPRLRHLLVFALSAVLLLGVGYVAVFWFVFVGVPFVRNERDLPHLREVGYLPAEARDIFISDARGGFHGDGDMLLVFSCTAECLDRVKARVAQDYAPQIERAMTVGWSRYAAANTAQIDRTIQWMTSGQSAERLAHVPDTKGHTIVFLCGDKGSGPNNYCRNLFAIDVASGHFWYMTIQT